jgi:hypothetical protein
MGRIARRLDGDTRLIDPGRQHAGSNQRIIRATNAVEHVDVNVLGGHDFRIAASAPEARA